MKRVVGGFLLSVAALFSSSVAADDTGEFPTTSEAIDLAIKNLDVRTYRFDDSDSRPRTLVATPEAASLMAGPEPVSWYLEIRADGTRLLHRTYSVASKLYTDRCVVGTMANESEDTIEAIVAAVKGHPCGAAAVTGGAALLRWSNAAASNDIDADKLAKTYRELTRVDKTVSERWASVTIDVARRRPVAIFSLCSIVAGIYDIFSGDHPLIPVLLDYLGFSGSSEPQVGT
jgi:hypothetical protein